MAKMAHGIADDLLTCTVLASEAPVILAPAMNVKMWNNAATQANLGILKERGIHLVDPGTGGLACGYEGRGRLATLDKIVAVVEKCVKSRRR